ncbi:TetR/AcrR family transcriptional regulator [Streptomyces xiamenensis]
MPRTAASPGGCAKGRARREQIVASAVEAYSETGYHGASLREIAKRAGISHAGPPPDVPAPTLDPDRRPP